MQQPKRLVQVSIWSALAICLSIAEGFIPMPGVIYGAKLGLSNIAIMVVMACVSPSAALYVLFIKSFISAFLTGAVSAIPYSISGGLLSWCVMLFAYKNASGKISFVGISVLGAIAHSVAQIAVASAIIQSMSIFAYLPVLIAVSSATGFFTGLCVNMTIYRLVK